MKDGSQGNWRLHRSFQALSANWNSTQITTHPFLRLSLSRIFPQFSVCLHFPISFHHPSPSLFLFLSGSLLRSVHPRLFSYEYTANSIPPIFMFHFLFIGKKADWLKSKIRRAPPLGRLIRRTVAAVVTAPARKSNFAYVAGTCVDDEAAPFCSRNATFSFTLRRASEALQVLTSPGRACE